MRSWTEGDRSSLLRKFWEVEALGILPSTEKAKTDPALIRFQESVSFDGHQYSICLLWKLDVSPLPYYLETRKEKTNILEIPACAGF
ncbi:hypothetical protein T11_7204 [Trichinella zimbabwensis]|uniref:Uncharacterized protein n=1 Tax=Trichinella zimbabwensis TaxID=268475 RepID=A0A0V1HR62_9BILA|nr:hypothetical protein T11_7204 [Trichinella zimbabwensis]